MSNISKIKINQLSTLHGHTGPVHEVIKGRTESELISCGGDGWAILWNLNTAAENELIYRADSPILSACIDNESGMLLLGDKSGVLHFYSFESNALVRQVFHHPAGIISLKSTENGVYSCGVDGKVSLWNVNSCQVEKSIRVSRYPLINCVEALDGRIITANVKGSVFVLDKNLEEISNTFNYSQGDITAIDTTGDYVYIGFVTGKIIGISIDDEKPVSESDPHWYSVTGIDQVEGFGVISVGSDGKISLLKELDLKVLGQWPDDPETTVNPAINTVLIEKDICYVGSDDRTIKVYKIN